MCGACSPWQVYDVIMKTFQSEFENCVNLIEPDYAILMKRKDSNNLENKITINLLNKQLKIILRT